MMNKLHDIQVNKHLLKYFPNDKQKIGVFIFIFLFSKFCQK